MSLIKPTITEALFVNFFKLDPTRPYYYFQVYRFARSIFISLGMTEKIDDMNELIANRLEIPLRANFVAIVSAFYNPRFMYSRRAYTKVGDEVDNINISRWDIEQALEEIKNWIHDEITELAQYVRFTRPTEIMM